MNDRPGRKKIKKRTSLTEAFTLLLVILSVIAIAATIGFIAINLIEADNETVSQEVAYIVPTLADQKLESGAISRSPATDELSSAPIPKSTPTSNPIRPKAIIYNGGNQRSAWTPTPLPSPTPSPTPTPHPTFVSLLNKYTLLRPAGLSPDEQWIDVNLTDQKLVAYEGHLPVFESLVSSGLPKHPTVTGQFRIWLRFKAQDMNGRRLGYDYYLKNVPYVQYFYQDYALHGTFWHNNFGNPMSHGCVNLPTPSAEWLFNWAEYGTIVNIHY